MVDRGWWAQAHAGRMNFLGIGGGRNFQSHDATFFAFLGSPDSRSPVPQGIVIDGLIGALLYNHILRTRTSN